MAELWGISERTVRNYCAERRIEGAVLIGKTWKIPVDAVRPGRRKLKRPETLLEVLREQQSSNQHGGIYHKLQIELTYNSNHIEGSKLTHDQTRYIFETNTLGFENEAVNVDDIVETVNHFRCIDYVIENAEKPLTEAFIKELHKMLKECLSHDIVPFIISDDLKMFYYRGLKNREQERGWLTDTVLTVQDRFKAYLDYFQIRYQG